MNPASKFFIAGMLDSQGIGGVEPKADPNCSHSHIDFSNYQRDSHHRYYFCFDCGRYIYDGDICMENVEWYVSYMDSLIVRKNDKNETQLSRKETDKILSELADKNYERDSHILF